MKTVALSIAVSLLASAAVAGVAEAGETFVQGMWGPTWYQSDSNSNHHAFAQGAEVGHSLDLPLDIVLSYMQSENSDGGVSQDVNNGPYQHLNFDFEYKTVVLYVMPRVDFGRVSFSAGPGYGTVYSTMDVVMEDGRSDSYTGWQDNLSLRADLNVDVTDHLSVGISYRHDYFEAALGDREVSDYEVNQDRVYYLIGGRYTF